MQVVYFGPTFTGGHMVFINEPNFIGRALNDEKTYPKPPSVYNQIKHLTGDGLVTSTGDKWFKHRKILTPIFHLAALKLSVPSVISGGRKFLTDLENVSCLNIRTYVSSVVCTYE
jgi:cytochrome P450